MGMEGSIAGKTGTTDDERDLSYFNLGIGYNILPGEVFLGRNRAFNTALYIIVNAGNVDFAGDNRFSYGYGVGYSLLFMNWFSFHLDFRDHVFDIDLIGKDKTTHNLEFNTGLSFYF